MVCMSERLKMPSFELRHGTVGLFVMCVQRSMIAEDRFGMHGSCWQMFCHTIILISKVADLQVDASHIC